MPDLTGLGQEGRGRSGSQGGDTIIDLVAGEDLLVLSAGVGIRSERHGDFNSDGVADTLLALTQGGSITLLGVADFDPLVSTMVADQPMLAI